jgi:glycosyltransferase involved in cell wall biosynthesis
MIKASVIVSSYNCNEALPNTLYAISRQKTNFEFEVCFLDDCSYEDPKPIYDYFLRVKHKKGIRLKQHIGNIIDSRRFPKEWNFKSSFSMAFEMATADIVIWNHGDVIMATDNIIQEFVDKMESKTIQIPDVRTIPVPENLYINFEEGVNNILKNFKDYPLYQGDRLSFAPTLMGFYKKDLYDLEYDKNPSEGHITAMIDRKKYNKNFRNDIVGIHQAHERIASIHFTDPRQALNWSNEYPQKEYYQ